MSDFFEGLGDFAAGFVGLATLILVIGGAFWAGGLVTRLGAKPWLVWTAGLSTLLLLLMLFYPAMERLGLFVDGY